MIRKVFYILPIVLAVLFGRWAGEGGLPRKERVALDSIDSNKEYPLREYKSFAVIVHSYKNSAWCKKVLRSVFEQDYDHFRVLFFDDNSQDGTREQVQSFVLDNHQEHKVIFIQNEEKAGSVACLHRAVNYLADSEIMIPMDSKDWFAHPNVLSRLNEVYQNPDVWLTAICPILYPSYETYPVKEIGRAAFPSFIPTTFYARLFKEIPLGNLMKNGRFMEESRAYLLPIVQMSGGRFRVLQEPLFIVNQARCANNAVNLRIEG